MRRMLTRFIWLHGFASGPQSRKAVYVRGRLEALGVHLVVPDLNRPAFFDLTVTRMLRQIDVLAQGERPVVLFGSSLGGFAAATWAATRPGRTAALVLLAPAFDLASRWAEGMQQDDLREWRRTGRRAFDHFAHGRKEELSSGFLDDAATHAAFPLPEAPTLVLQGTRDEVVAPALARDFTARMVGRAALVELDDEHELNRDLPRLWREMETHLLAVLPGVTARGRPRST